MSLKREDAMTHAPDLLLLSQYDPEMGEVAAFEELIGSHGGLGGPQTQPFILHPTEWELDEPVPLGAPAIYRNIRRWLESIDIPLGKPARASPGRRSDGGGPGRRRRRPSEITQDRRPRPLDRPRAPLGPRRRRACVDRFLDNPSSGRSAIALIVIADVLVRSSAARSGRSTPPNTPRSGGRSGTSSRPHDRRLRRRHPDGARRCRRGAVLMLRPSPS